MEYINELFRKLQSYNGYELTRFIDFHYRQYPDKKEFLRFLQYEVAVRAKCLREKSKDSVWGRMLEHCQMWIGEQKDLVVPPASETSVDQFASVAAPVTVAESPQIGQIIDIVEAKISEVTQSHAGRITLNDNLNFSKVIQVLLLLKDLRAPGKMPQPLFKNFSTTDLAAVLRNFEGYTDKKVNTIQRMIADCNDKLSLKEPTTVVLDKALRDYFYQSMTDHG